LCYFQIRLTKQSNGWFLSSIFAIPLRSILWQKCYLKTTVYRNVRNQNWLQFGGTHQRRLKEMNNLTLQALQYGVLGLCALSILFSAQMIYAEQKRDKVPRKGILCFAGFFMIFCLALALLVSFVQLREAGAENSIPRLEARIQEMQDLLSERDFQLHQTTLELQKLRMKVVSAQRTLRPVSQSRGTAISYLPEGLARELLENITSILESLVQELEMHETPVYSQPDLGR
jgi:hypothetical protein